MYVILVDNGRSNVLKDPAATAALHCIRCGACMYACPVYRRVGGWAYGWVYPGPIGAILTPHLIGLKPAGKLPFASSLCGACAEVCPAKIDLAHQLVHLRHRAVNEPSAMNSWRERLLWMIWAWCMGGRTRYKLLMTGVRIGVRLAKFLPWHPGKLGIGPAAARCHRRPAAISEAGGDDTKIRACHELNAGFRYWTLLPVLRSTLPDDIFRPSPVNDYYVYQSHPHPPSQFKIGREFSNFFQSEDCKGDLCTEDARGRN